jgi:hypothetical protein
MRYRCLAVTAASMTLSSWVFAEASETDRSLAQSLFEQGKALMDAGQLAEACPKLQESQRLDPGGGTLLNLALCHERQGRIASAWTEFKEALSVARRDGRQERIDAASEHIAALEPQLPFLTIAVASPAQGQELRLDGAVVGEAAWGAPLSLDPGTHVLSAKAPGRKPWSLSVTLVRAEKRSVAVPALQAEDATSPSEPPAPADPVSAAPSQRASDSKPLGRKSNIAGLVVGGVGVAAIGVGGYFGIRALSKRSQSTKLCSTDTTCSAQGVTYNEQAYDAAWVSNIGIGVGLVAVGVGAYWLLASPKRAEGAPSKAKNSTRLTADVGVLRGGGAMLVSGQW